MNLEEVKIFRKRILKIFKDEKITAREWEFTKDLIEQEYNKVKRDSTL